ncbi:energy-coupling factor transporter transmembrane component T [Microbacterium sp. No. 7]|uniref:energy-coupling factor transporter transmembrane component T n=1 Tax=Microbacterium sp. No. 7 TaxID=1714373 RepID=UPI0006ED1F64|nr:energy-coupling factor transporter transmembrane component T [Microbacterium sp. No. 7]ALJ19699.1 hypothetical protein AOA12_07185 [Microbacterium sp. No. 7]
MALQQERTEPEPVVWTAATPDVRIGLLLVVVLAVGTGLIRTESGLLLLTLWALGLLLVFRRLHALWGLVTGYLFLSLIQRASIWLVAVPGVAYVGAAATMGLHAYPMAAALWLVLSGVPMSQIMAALAAIRVPRMLLIVTMVVYRYIPTLFGELRVIALGNRLRSTRPGWRRWATSPITEAEHLLVPIVMRSALIADELSSVAVCKGLDEHAARTALIPPRIGAADILATAMTIAVVVALALTAGRIEDGWGW